MNPTSTEFPLASEAPFFSHSRSVGDLVFVSGQMAFDLEWRIAGSTVGEQTQRCIARINDILQSEGLGLPDVIKATVWLARVEDFAEFNRSYAATFGATGSPAPARSTVRADLMVPGALVEIEAIARNPRALGA